MQWSKLKTKIKEFICPELQDRVDFFVTSYRKSHDGADRVWITVDGEKFFECKHYIYERAEAEAYHSGFQPNQIESVLASKEIHSPGNFGESMREYLDMPINESLNSDNPLIKAFAIIDRRTGKRTLAEVKITDSDRFLVKKFYKLRCSSIVF